MDESDSPELPRSLKLADGEITVEPDPADGWRIHWSPYPDRPEAPVALTVTRRDPSLPHKLTAGHPNFDDRDELLEWGRRYFGKPERP